MKRAAILIGIDKTGNLPRLHDAASGARRMEQWALAQGIDPKLIHTFTDEAGPVEVGEVKRAIRKLVESGTIEQLIVYFAGHGVNIRYGEYWLFTDAPDDPQAAVNVDGSIALARQAGIPHVVLISDACRTAAEGIQAQLITGSEIFPNNPVGGTEQPVDIFFASTLGMPAAEVKDPLATSSTYKAVYTGALVDALDGKDIAIVEKAMLDGKVVYLVRPRPLKKSLQTLMTRRLAQLNLQAKVNQVPDARITSDVDAWLSQLPGVPSGAAPAAPVSYKATWANLPGLASRRDVILTADALAGLTPPATPQTVSNDLLSTALHHGVDATIAQLDLAAANDVVDVNMLARGVQRDVVPFGPLHFETGCGFKIRGARVVESVSSVTPTEILDDAGSLVRVSPINNGPAASVLLILENKSGVLVPAIKGFIAALTFDNGELIDLSYEPSEYTGRWQEYQQHVNELRYLRSVIASAARLGVFRLEGDNALALARQMQYSKTIDPSLALYAAYAYHDLQQGDRISEMSNYLLGDLGMAFFDIGLVGHALDGKNSATDHRFYPFVPLLAQGWALLAAYRVSLPEGLEGIQRYLMPSLWTQFMPEGVTILKNVLQKGSLR